MEETGTSEPRARPVHTRRRWLCLTICAGAVGLVGSSLRPQQARAAPEPATLRSLGSLVARDHRLRIDLGPLGPIYTLTDRDGTFVDADADLQRLDARHPTLGLQHKFSDQGDGVPLMMVIDREE